MTRKIEKIKEEKILGIPEPEEINISKNYEDKSKKYKITNLTVKNTPIFVTGDLVETFIGGKNLDARAALKQGANKVITKNIHGTELFKIEVVE